MTRLHWFVADLHLTDRDPDAMQRFLFWLQQIPAADVSLYLLGDIFDAWCALPGDYLGGIREVVDGLNALVARGAKVMVLVGNRDFLLARASPFRADIAVWSDAGQLDLGGRRVYLSHGDELCANDWRYQAYKRFIRSAPVFALFRRLSLDRRRRLTGALAHGSKLEVARKPQAALRPPLAVYQALARRGFDAVVHGHVHRRDSFVLETEDCLMTVHTLPAWDEGPSWLEYDVLADAWRWHACPSAGEIV